MTPARFLASTLVCALPQLSIGFVSSPLSIAIPKSIPAELYSGTLLDPCGEDRPNLTGALEKCELYEFILKDHKPLGCSVEESLADEPDGSNLVFVAELTEGGNAQNAGIQVGDVVVQLSGTFDEVMDVTGLGLDKIRSLVGGRLKEDPLTIRIARGSDVLERHESALVDLCILGEDKKTVDCITAIHSQDRDMYYSDDDVILDCQDDDTECMLDSIWDTWTEELPVEISDEETENDEPKEEKKKVAPWASRSSGSGTWVRDPKTGKLVNIDE